MDVLQKLFESHFRSPVGHVQPIQGHLGGSGRKIIRLTGGGKSAVGILYDVREENIAYLEFSRHFKRHGLPVPEIYADDLSQGAYLEGSVSQSINGVTTLSSRGRPRSKLQSLLPAWQLRSPVHCLGPELFQVLLPEAGGHSI